MIYVIFDRQF